jgi:transaldolase
MKPSSKMRETVALGTQFWNDSCDLKELAEAIENGATGATSNPVIVAAAARNGAETWTPYLDRLSRDYPAATEDDLAWKLVDEMARRAARLLEPVFHATRGQHGYLSVQVNPKFYRDPDKMAEHGKHLASLAPNIAIKAPCTAAGLRAMESLVSVGINVNATVSFTVSQAAAAGAALERGMAQAARNGVDTSRLHPYVTLMVGRLEDHLQRVTAKQGVTVEPGHIHWAGVAAFKRARRIFKERGYRSTLLAAAYRHHLHWSELIGDGTVLTIPYAWWKQFEASDIEPRRRVDEPVDPRIVETLLRKFPDFRKAYEPDELKPTEFAAYPATVHTLNQFLGGYQELLGLVRERMLANPV